VPCVATNVGDNDYIIKNTGRIVAVNNDAAMPAAWQELLDNESR
jgi:hypothetical protein